MTNLTLLTSGRLAPEFHKYIQANHPDVSIELATTKEALTEKIKDANVYAGFNHLDGLDVTQLRWIHSFGAGIDGFLANPSISDAKIPISRSTGAMGRGIGEYCLTHCLARQQHVIMYHQQQQRQEWSQQSPGSLSNQSVLILGTGQIAQGIADVFRPLVKQVIGASQSGSSVDAFDQIIPFSQIRSIATSTSIIINALPLTPATLGLVDQSFFSLFTETTFINIGRGGTVNTSDLLQAIEKGHLDQAILDVFEEEPLPSQSELWQHPQVTITPHVAGLTSIEDVIEAFEQALENIQQGQYTAPLFVDYQKGY